MARYIWLEVADNFVSFRRHRYAYLVAPFHLRRLWHEDIILGEAEVCRQKAASRDHYLVSTYFCTDLGSAGLGIERASAVAVQSLSWHPELYKIGRPVATKRLDQTSAVLAPSVLA